MESSTHLASKCCASSDILFTLVFSTFRVNSTLATRSDSFHMKALAENKERLLVTNQLNSRKDVPTILTRE
jgi:hypothetical protein